MPSAFSFELPSHIFFLFLGKTFAAMAMLHAMRHVGMGAWQGIYLKERKARLILSLFSGPPKKLEAINNKLNEQGERERGESWRGETGVVAITSQVEGANWVQQITPVLVLLQLQQQQQQQQQCEQVLLNYVRVGNARSALGHATCEWGHVLHFSLALRCVRHFV